MKRPHIHITPDLFETVTLETPELEEGQFLLKQTHIARSGHSKPLNTLYVVKNLRFHGLMQAYSRTNRILNEVKSQGNIVVFRNSTRS